MNQVTTNETTMSSLDFLNNYINPARLDAGENETRNADFIKRVMDELDIDETKLSSRVINRNHVKYIALNHDQMLLIGMRESKAVRKSVLAKLKELEKPTIPTSMEMIVAISTHAVKQEKALLHLESQVTHIGSEVDLIKNKLDNSSVISDQLEFGFVPLNKLTTTINITLCTFLPIY